MLLFWAMTYQFTVDIFLRILVAQSHIMELVFDFLKILSSVVVFITGVIKIFEFIDKYKEHKFMSALKTTFSNPVGRIFIVSFIITGVIYYVQWNRPKPIVEKTNPIVRNVHDTVKVKDSSNRNRQLNKPNSNLIHHRPDLSLGSIKPQTKPLKADTVKAKNLVTAPNYGNQQVGDNNTQNNFGKLDHHPQQGDIAFITHYLHDKNKKVVLAYETPDSDSANYCKELKGILEQYGYQVELFGHLDIGSPPQEHKVMVDTVNYRVSVEWNYN